MNPVRRMRRAFRIINHMQYSTFNSALRHHELYAISRLVSNTYVGTIKLKEISTFLRRWKKR